MKRHCHALYAAALLIGMAQWGRSEGAGSFAAHDDDPLPASDSPIGAVERLLQAYAQRRLDQFAGVLAADFIFVFGDPQLRASHPDGFSREDEIASADHLFHGFTDAAGVSHPAARSIVLSSGLLHVAPDPVRTESTSHYQVVVASHVRMRIELEDGGALESGGDHHEFHTVRGDASHRTKDQPGDADHWFVHVWTESVEPVYLAMAARRPGRSPVARDTMPGGEARTPHAPRDTNVDVSGPPAIFALQNPTRLPITIQFQVPHHGAARLDIFDVAGRRILRRELGERSPGVYRVTLADGEPITPGIYWVKLTQGQTLAKARFTIVR